MLEFCARRTLTTLNKFNGRSFIFRTGINASNQRHNQTASIHRIISEKEVETYAHLSGDINPIHLPFLPFLGLGFPLLLVINIAFMLLWLFVRSKWFWCALLVVIISIPFQMKIFSLNIISIDIPTHNKSQFKLMSYNVRLFDLYNPKIKSEYLSNDCMWCLNELTKEIF